MRNPPGRSRKLLFGAITMVLLIAVAESFSIAALYIVDSEGYSPHRARAKRDAVHRQAQARSAMPGSSARPEPSSDLVQREVIHPFLGFVRDRDHDTEGAISPLGFHAAPPPSGDAARRFTIGVFGASLAHGLASRAQAFAEVLETSPYFRGRQIHVRSFSLGGYKQPQQLIALNYLLALGEPLDMVVNLDGFNDVTLAPEQYADWGLYPFYPRGWTRRVADLPDVEAQRLVGEISYLEHRRMRRAEWCSGALLSVSPTCHLVWRLSNRSIGGRTRALREKLAKRPPGERSFLTHGPSSDYASDEELLLDLAGFWRRSSLLMHRICQQSGILYFHFLQPNQYVPDSKRLTRTEKIRAFDPNHRWGRFVRRGYPQLVAEGQELSAAGVSFHDMRMVFADVHATVYRDACCHLNHDGLDLLGQAMARIIVRELEP